MSTRAQFGTTQRVGPWVVAFTWPEGVDQGGPRHVNISPASDATEDEIAAGVSSTVVRQIDFQAANAEWRQATSEGPSGDRYTGASERFRLLLSRGIGDEYLAFLAYAYVNLVEDGEQSVTNRLSEMTGKSAETIRQHLIRARKAELLTTVKGKAGGRLTQKCLRIIAEMSD